MAGKVLTPEVRRERRLQLRLRRNLPSTRLASVQVHGLRSGYTSGCRCDDCTDAEADYCRQRDDKKRRSERGRRNATLETPAQMAARGVDWYHDVWGLR